MSWCSKKQASVTKSTPAAEYVALSQATQKAIWMRPVAKPARQFGHAMQI